MQREMNYKGLRTRNYPSFKKALEGLGETDHERAVKMGRESYKTAERWAVMLPEAIYPLIHCPELLRALLADVEQQEAA